MIIAMLERRRGPVSRSLVTGMHCDVMVCVSDSPWGASGDKGWCAMSKGRNGVCRLSGASDHWEVIGYVHAVDAGIRVETITGAQCQEDRVARRLLVRFVCSLRRGSACMG